MDETLRTIERFIPKKVYRFFQPAYHYLLTLTGAVRYAFPSRKLFVIGVTGTKGKSSTTEIINAILEKAGLKTALSNTIRFKIGNESKANMYKMSMPGRFFMQQFLHDAAQAHCTHAVIEVTSEGARQFRNKWIDLDTFVWTNLAPEHIESHGSYDAYKKAKYDIAAEIAVSDKPVRTMVLNADDEEVPLFLSIPVEPKVMYSFNELDAFHEDQKGVRFIYKKQLFTSPLVGKFNAYNILAAIKAAEAMGIRLDIIREAIKEFGHIAGRAEHIEAGQNFEVIVDYAHTPDSLTALYEAFDHAHKKICVLGNTGGGRDMWKRPEMAKIAEQYCDHIILTNEDPYDEDPETIVNQMKVAIEKKPVTIILDRREAIANALSLAEEGDAVLITGKGTDPYIMEAHGKKVPWSDAKVTVVELKKLLKK
jgi:UDP-N-acetylmuramoyl-L-alanyl-D-glutamate--2,6-diaminopimelate ligase